MKAQTFVFYGALFGLVATLFSGCASKSRPYEWSSTIITEPDGTRTETRTIERNSTIMASGYKLDLAGFGVDETWQEGTLSGPGGSTYKLNSEGAKATPESQALAAFQSGLSAANQFYGRGPSEATLSEGDMAEVQSLLSELRAEKAIRENKLTAVDP